MVIACVGHAPSYDGGHLQKEVLALHRLEPGADGPAVPAVEEERAPFVRWLLIDLLEGEAELIGARRFQMQPRQRGELGAALGRQRRLVAQPEIAAAFQLGSALAFHPPHLVDGIVDELDRVEFVEGDFGLSEVVGDALDVGGAHVDADLLDAGDIGVMGIDVIGNWLTEINVTSPTGLQQIDRFDGVNTPALIWDAIEAKVGRR